MKTYVIDPIKAASLRWHLLVSFLYVVIVGLVLAYVGTVNGDSLGVGLLAAIFLGGCLWNVVSTWRAIWNLWEWPGVFLGMGVGLGVGVLNAISDGVLGTIVSIIWAIFLLSKLGKQASGAAPSAKRAVFEG